MLMDKFTKVRTNVMLTEPVKRKAKKIAKKLTGKESVSEGIRIAVADYKGQTK